MNINLNHIKKMDFVVAKKKLISLEERLAKNEFEYTELNKIYMETHKKINLCENTKIILLKEIKKLEEFIETENIFKSLVQGVEAFDTLTEAELTVISKGMDKSDYRDFVRKDVNPHRLKDLEQLIKNVIEFKKLYPGWILHRMAPSGKYDTLPPKIFYKFTYKSPHGHYMSYDGFELSSS
jgi:hypothetical protein